MQLHHCLHRHTLSCDILSYFRKACFSLWLQETKSFAIELKPFIRENWGRLNMLYPSRRLSGAIIIRNRKIGQRHSKGRHQNTKLPIHCDCDWLKRCLWIKNRWAYVKRVGESLFQLLFSASFLECCVFLCGSVCQQAPSSRVSSHRTLSACWGVSPRA